MAENQIVSVTSHVEWCYGIGTGNQT